jgi:hypothetical protein
MKDGIRWVKRAARALLLMLLLVDLLAIYEFLRYGPPIMTISEASPSSSEAIFKVSRVPLSNADLMIFSGLVAAHLLVICLLWTLRRETRPDH